jgi:hypothetical protein
MQHSRLAQCLLEAPQFSCNDAAFFLTPLQFMHHSTAENKLYIINIASAWIKRAENDSSQRPQLIRNIRFKSSSNENLHYKFVL